MPQLNVTLNMPDAMLSELQDAARSLHMRPEVFVSEAVEATLASRRLDRITDPNAITSPRMPVHADE
jgi:hypothetical protein